MRWILRAVVARRLGGFWGFIAMTLGGLLWREWHRRGGMEAIGRRLESVGAGVEQYARPDADQGENRAGTTGRRGRRTVPR